MTEDKLADQLLKETAIAKLIATTGVTEAELRALGLRSDDDN